jgi:hypothetical protein
MLLCAGTLYPNDVATSAREAGSLPATQVALLRCFVGNPFRPVSLHSAWLEWNGSTVRHLARMIHEASTFDHLPILADALEEAGCTELILLGSV